MELTVFIATTFRESRGKSSVTNPKIRIYNKMFQTAIQFNAASFPCAKKC